MTAQTFILPRDKVALSRHLERLPESRKWRVTIEPYRKPHSNQQMRYLRGVAYKILQDATGQPADDWHEFFLGEFFGWESYQLFGKEKQRPARRTGKLSTVEFAEFVDYVQMRAAENNIYIPDPNEQ